VKKFDRGFVSYIQGLLTMCFINIAMDLAPWGTARVLPKRDTFSFTVACILMIISYTLCEILKKPKPTIDGETFDLDGLELNTKSINDQSANISIETKYNDKVSRKAIKALLWWLHFPKRISNVDIN
jgi:hypothetical protein